MISKWISGDSAQEILDEAVWDIHTNGPVNGGTFERLSYIKNFHPELFSKYETKLVTLMGLFYKPIEAESFLEHVYQNYAEAIKEETGQFYTPVQASMYKQINRNKYFSFSAPTSAGKSYLLRELIKKSTSDIVIVVPSRALIAEFYSEIIRIVGNKVLVLQFIDDIYRQYVDRRVFIVTPERATELFKYSQDFNVGFIIMDEAQISEDGVRGLKFDAFFRRSLAAFPDSKKIFAHPFITNPQGQLIKHSINGECSASTYKQHSVGKIFLSHNKGAFSYFSPYTDSRKQKSEIDIVENRMNEGGTLLAYVTKSSIYSGAFSERFSKYLELCQKVTDESALKIIEDLRKYIGASKSGSERHSVFIEMMEKGVAVHHGSMPLKARLLVESFIRTGSAKICFATSTLNQGINMPFDVVWVDNFRSMDALTLKNLIGRAGRSTSNSNEYDFGYTVVNATNVKKFCELIQQDTSVSTTSGLDGDLQEVDDDLRDVIEAVRNDSFNDEMHLPQSQVDRLDDESIQEDILRVLNSLFVGSRIITRNEYYDLKERDKVKESFKKIFLRHLRRDTLEPAEQGVLSAAIPIMLWHIHNRSFSQLVSIRYSYLSRRDERRSLERRRRENEIDEEEYRQELESLKIKNSPAAFSIPDKNHPAAPLYGFKVSVKDIEYDKIVYDTYDYLDKVISQSICDPVCAAFEIYYQKNDDSRARSMQNYLRYGTDDDTEIWLLRYGFDMEDIEWIKGHIQNIDENNIEFNDSILEESLERLELVSRYI